MIKCCLNFFVSIHFHTNLKILLTISRFNCWCSCSVLPDHWRGDSRLHATSMSMREAFLVNTSAAVFFLQSILFFHRSAHLQKPDELVNILFRCVVKLGTSRDFKLYMYSCHVDHIVFGCCTTFSWFVFFFSKKLTAHTASVCNARLSWNQSAEH